MKIIKTETVYRGFFKVDKVTLQHQKDTFSREIYRNRNAVAALVYDTSNDRYILTEQYRDYQRFYDVGYHIGHNNRLYDFRHHLRYNFRNHNRQNHYRHYVGFYLWYYCRPYNRRHHVRHHFGYNFRPHHYGYYFRHHNRDDLRHHVRQHNPVSVKNRFRS